MKRPLTDKERKGLWDRIKRIESSPEKRCCELCDKHIPISTIYFMGTKIVCEECYAKHR